LRFAIGFCLAAASLLLFVAFAHAQPTDDSLRIYAVNIRQDPPQSRGPERGVYLRKGLVITAAHVVTPLARTKPTVRIAGMELPATAIREGKRRDSRRDSALANTPGAGSEDKDIANVAPEGTCLMAAEDIFWTATVAACLRSEVNRRSCTHVLRRF
jgi:hypothetical protein